MTHQPQFRPDLYRGTAAYYDRYRLPYPDALFDDLRARVPISGGGRLLDLACGTGQVACPLAGDFAEVWAVDQEPETIEFLAAKAARLGLGHLHTAVGRAEDVAVASPFELVTIGNAFHRLRRSAVADAVAPLIPAGGGIALLWGGLASQGEQAWQRATEDAFERWMHRAHTADRIPANWEQVIRGDPHEALLERAGFAYEGSFEFMTTHRLSIDDLIGYAYSTSFLSRDALGGHVDAFERDFRNTLLAAQPDGVLVADVSFKYDLARRR